MWKSLRSTILKEISSYLVTFMKQGLKTIKIGSIPCSTFDVGSSMFDVHLLKNSMLDPNAVFLGLCFRMNEPHSIGELLFRQAAGKAQVGFKSYTHSTRCYPYDLSFQLYGKFEIEDWKAQ
jgi:hypothetical protein